ncbi:hypothetical protein MCOR04_010335, partial [Pyricularia oryzae]
MDRAEIRHETKSRARPEGCKMVTGEKTPWYVLWGATTARLEMDQRIFHNGPFERPGRSIRLMCIS